jgi:hypothetical protein
VPLPPALKFRYAGLRRKLGGVVIYLQTTTGTMTGIGIELRRGHRRVAYRLLTATTRRRRLVLRANGHLPGRGRYTLTASWRGLTLASRRFRIR